MTNHYGLGMSRYYPRTVYLAFVVAVGLVLALPVGWMLLHHGTSTDAAGHYYGLDFINSWAAPQLAMKDSSQLFSLLRYNQGIEALHGQAVPEHFWSYPLHALPWLAPLGQLPLPVAFAVWSVLGVAALLFAMRRAAPHAAVCACVGVLFAPAVLLSLLLGQNGLFTAALTIGALLCLAARPFWAGLCLAFLTMKPQLGVLWPVVLILRCRWKVIAWAVLGTVALIGLSIAGYGLAAWEQFFSVTIPFHTAMVHQPLANRLFEPLMPTVSVMLQQWGLHFSTAMQVQWVVSVGMVVLLATALRKPIALPRMALLLTSATALVAPYFFCYDLTAMSATLVWLILTTPQLSRTQRIVYALGFWLPALCPWLYYFLPVAPLVTFAVFVVTWRCNDAPPQPAEAL